MAAGELQAALHRREDLADAEQADDGDQEVEADQQLVVTEGHAQRAGHLVEADGAQREAQAHGGQHLEGRALAHADEAGEGQEEDREELGRPELQGEPGNQRAPGR